MCAIDQIGQETVSRERRIRKKHSLESFTSLRYRDVCDLCRLSNVSNPKLTMGKQLVHCPPPSREVLSAFSVPSGSQVLPLDGGQLQCYLAGNFVLKHFNAAALEEAEWSAALMFRIRQQSEGTFPPPFRIPLPYRSSSNTFVFQEWTCTEFASGTIIPDWRSNPESICEPGFLRSDHWLKLIDASRAFHSCLRSLVHEKPPFVCIQDNRWTFAHKVAWGERHYACRGVVGSDLLQRLWAILEKLHGDKEDDDAMMLQLVHGDMAGNVLFDPEDSVPPAIIDFTPYWRPVEWAEAVIAVDALIWFAEGQRLLEIILEENGDRKFMMRLLVKAMVFRLVTVSIREGDIGLGDDTARIVKAVELLEFISSL